MRLIPVRSAAEGKYKGRGESGGREGDEHHAGCDTGQIISNISYCMSSNQAIYFILLRSSVYCDIDESECSLHAE